jgi:hypothetical protein
MEFDGSDNVYTCTCGRSFSQPGPLKHHQRNCLTRKKRLFGALEKAKEIWTSKKRKRFEDVGRQDAPSPHAMDPIFDVPDSTTGEHWTVRTLYYTTIIDSCY